MTGAAAIFEIQQRGVDVYVESGSHDVILRARGAGKPILTQICNRYNLPIPLAR
jgi:hypothetical protein